MFMSLYDQVKSDEFTTAIYRVILDSNGVASRSTGTYGKRTEFRRMSDTLGHFYEGLGVLVKEGMLNIRWIALLFCAPTRWYWEKYLPIVEEGRRTLVGNKR